MIWRWHIHKMVLHQAWFLVELEFGNAGFWGEGKTSRSKGENQKQTQPTYGVDVGIWTRATLVGARRRVLSPLRHPLIRKTKDFWRLTILENRYWVQKLN